jgi:hypothetical protein
LHAPPGYLDQSAAVLEIIALLVATVHVSLKQAKDFATDSADVFYGFRNAEGAVKHASMCAGLWRQICEGKEGKEITIRKVKARRNEA